jgi:thiamine biosynthesis lipoprotein
MPGFLETPRLSPSLRVSARNQTYKRRTDPLSPKICGQLKQIVLVLFLSGTAAGPVPAWDGPPLLRVAKSADAMGSTYSVEVYGRDRAQLEDAADAALDEAKRLDELLSNYKPESEWSRVNQRAAAGPVAVSPELFQLLSACLSYSRESEGAFDISVGPLMKVWGFYKGTGHLPHAAEVAAAMTKVGYRHIHLDARAQTVSFDRQGVELDPGGIGKGYAVDRMVDVLKRKGIGIALVAGSGSSIYGLGAPPSSPQGWPVDIRDPWTHEKTVATVHLKDMSMSTSGSYEKFFRAEGKIYAHIMDPRTGYPSQGSVAVSVITPKTIDSEAWAKPYFIHGRRWASEHKPKDFRVYFCEDRRDQPCAWLQ